MACSTRSTDSPPPLQIVTSYWSETSSDEELETASTTRGRQEDNADSQCRGSSPESISADLLQRTDPPNTEPAQEGEMSSEPIPEASSESDEGTTDVDDESADDSRRKSTPRSGTARKYAIRLDKLPGETQKLIGQVSKFFTENINLERRANAISKSTMNKSRERILCK